MTLSSPKKNRSPKRPPRAANGNGAPPPATLEGRQPLHEMVQEKIKSYIIEHNCQPGDPLPNEREMATLFKVSRTSVREGVKSLSALGVIEVRHGAGLFVQNFSMNRLLENFSYDLQFSVGDLTDMFEIRFHIEYGMAGRAIHAVTAEQLAKLAAIVERMRIAAENANWDVEEDREFHRVMWENVNNKALPKILDVSFLVRQKTLMAIHAYESMDPVFTYHRHHAIYSALRDRDLHALKTSIICHYTLFDSKCRIEADSIEADFIRHSIDFEMRLQLAVVKSRHKETGAASTPHDSVAIPRDPQKGE